MPIRFAATLVAVALVFAACGNALETSGPTAGASAGTGTSADPIPTRPPVDLSAVPARVHVEASAANSAWIGPAGGELSAVAPDGTAYHLAFPAGALLQRTPIAMTPIAAVDDLGFSGGLAGAVYLQPAGLQLGATATLTITTSHAAAAGTRLVGIDMGHDAATIDLVPAFGDAGEVKVLVDHFSVRGGAFGTTVDLARFGSTTPGSLGAAMSTLLAFDTPWSSNTSLGVEALLLTAWDQLLKPKIQDVTDDVQLIEALAEWRQFVFMLNLWAHAGDSTAAVADGVIFPQASGPLFVVFLEGQRFLADGMIQAIDANKATCEQTRDLTALANATFWARAGERYAPNFTAWPDRATGCAAIVLAVANLPTNLVNGGADSLNLQFAFEFADGTRTVEGFEVQLSASGFTFTNGQLPSLTSSQPAQASLTESVTADQPPPYSLGASACWVRDGLNMGVCSAQFNSAFGGGVTPPPPPTPALGTGAPPSFAGSYFINVTCNFVNYGTGTGQITQNGDQVTMSWSVTLNPNRDEATRDQLCWAPFARNLVPTSGTITGVAAMIDGAPTLVISSADAGPCQDPTRPPPATTIISTFGWLLPVGGCIPPGTPMRYKASRSGP